MPQVEMPDMSPKKEKELEYLRAKVEQQEADLAYIAMMTDIDMEGEEDGNLYAD